MGKIAVAVRLLSRTLRPLWYSSLDCDSRLFNLSLVACNNMFQMSARRIVLQTCGEDGSKFVRGSVHRSSRRVRGIKLWR
uniref:Uncharacterized protein n=2 Tax=Leersia perrieri TaxID=77586 RepID=A0A0D9XT59_9ORYZ